MKKFNKGIISLIVVVVLVVGYLVIQHFRTKTVEDIAMEYVKNELAAICIDEQESIVFNESPESFIKNESDKLKSYFIDDELAYGLIIEQLEKDIKMNASSDFPITSIKLSSEEIILSSAFNKAVCNVKGVLTVTSQDAAATNDFFSQEVYFEYRDGQWKITHVSGCSNLYSVMDEMIREG